MRIQSNIVIGLLAVLTVTGCKEKFEPPVVAANQNLLVVDGFIDNSPDTTIIRLSRTRKLADGVAADGEINSSLILENADGTPVYNFQEMGNGTYIVPGMNLDNSSKYRLRIYTTDGKQYVSDELVVKPTPPIDSVNWQFVKDGVMIYVNTHDPSKNSTYYRWDYTDTWEYHSKYYSVLKYVNGAMLDRKPADNIFTCWTTKNSTQLLLGSSAKLSQDVIHLNPIRFIALNSIEISERYSILVRQYALPKDGFEYLQNLKKITEQLGSIFDAQPSQLTGNIHEVTNPNEPVLGFMTASSVQKKRIFIKHSEVVPWVYNPHCDDQIIVPLDSLEYYFGSGIYIPVTTYTVSGILAGYWAGSAFCVDCQERAGVTTKPDFW